MRSYIFFAISILIGLAAGLYAGWVLDPVETVGGGPNILRADYQADYVLMVAEVFQSEQNPERAAERLEFLGAANPLDNTVAALSLALEAGYPPGDLALLDGLDAALRVWDPNLTLTPAP